PEVGELHPALLEDRLAGLPVGLDDVPLVPGHLVVGVDARGGEDPLDLQALAAASGPRLGPGRLRHELTPRGVGEAVLLLDVLVCSAAPGSDSPGPRRAGGRYAIPSGRGARA